MGVKKNVLWFEISMADVETMAVSQSCNYLTEKTDCFFFGEGSVLGNIIKELASFDVFKDEVTDERLVN